MRTIQEFESWNTAHTPLNVESWKIRLVGFTEYTDIIQGISSGFKLGVQNREVLQSSEGSHGSNNLWEVIKKEVNLNRLLGPFTSPPLEDFQISPVQAIPKNTPGKFRFIHNLSAPHNHSMNDAIPEGLKSVSYCKISEVVDTLLRSGWRAAVLAKVDLKDAFRMVPIHRGDWGYLGMKVDNLYFINSVLPMGCGTSCAIFQKFTRALCWIAKKELPELHIFEYLDDFLLVSKDFKSAELHLTHFINMCKDLGVPISEKKNGGPISIYCFLGGGFRYS